MVLSMYPSPNADFGYDISVIVIIHPDYGNALICSRRY